MTHTDNLSNVGLRGMHADLDGDTFLVFWSGVPSSSSTGERVALISPADNPTNRRKRWVSEYLLSNVRTPPPDAPGVPPFGRLAKPRKKRGPGGIKR